MSRTEKIYVGIDGGGSFSEAVAVDATGRILCCASAGSLNYLSDGWEIARQNLRTLADHVRRIAPERCWHRVTIGTAALSGPADPEEKKRLLNGIFPMARTELISDCQTALAAATRDGAGVVVIAGTGSMVVAKGPGGGLAKAGGWGHLLGDEGSGYWIAIAAIRAALLRAETGGTKNRLLGQIRAYFRVRNVEELISEVYRETGKDRIAGLAEYLARKPRSHRAIASIFERAGQELADQTARAIRAAKFRANASVPVFWVGGVLERNQRVRESFIKCLRLAARNYAVVARALEYQPVFGAVWLSMKRGGLEVSDRCLSGWKRASGI